jgi:hypothetical protein
MMNDMQNDFKEDAPNSAKPNDNKGQVEEVPFRSLRQRSFITGWLNNLVQMGLGESLLRIGTNLFSIMQS